MTTKKVDWRVIATGLVCLTGLEICAMLKGFNGAILTTVIAVIALAIGVTIPIQLKTK